MPDSSGCQSVTYLVAAKAIGLPTGRCLTTALLAGDVHLKRLDNEIFAAVAYMLIERKALTRLSEMASALKPRLGS
jgi:hypothetical protein